MTLQDMTHEQERLEQQMYNARKRRAARETEKAIKSGDISTLKVTQRSIRKYLETYADTLNKVFREKAGRAGPRKIVASYLKEYSEAETLAYLTCRHVFNSCILGSPMTSVACELGRSVNQEIELAKFYKENKGAYKWVEAEIKRRRVTQRHWKYAFFARVASHKGVHLTRWDKKTCVQVGVFLLHHFKESTGLVTLFYRSVGKGKTRRELNVSSEAITLLEKEEAQAIEEVLAPFQLPMVIPPTPWTSLGDGGYLNTRLSLISNMERRFDTDDVEGLVHLKEADLSQVYEAIGHLDRTRFTIDKRVLKVINKLWARGQSVGSMPKIMEVSVPTIPKEADGPEGDKALRYEWRKQARNAHDINNTIRGQKVALRRSLYFSHKFGAYDAIYFPHSLDFRGRIYPLPSTLEPQGPDYVRGLIKFADGKPIEDDVAMGWLMIHGANCYGHDKITLEERIKWVEERVEELKAVSKDPFENDMWMEADKPFQFLQWVFDFVGVLNGQPSHIRVSMDGSCNGLQHFAAMLRDTVAAQAVNLANNDKPEDIYQEVANLVCKKLKAIKGEKSIIARKWLQLGVDRKTTKRGVMVMPYGGTMYSTVNYIDEWYRGKFPENPFGDDSGPACSFLGALVYKATREVVTSGKLIMDWLQGAAALAARHGVHLQWGTPSGFVVQQNYQNQLSKKVETRITGSTKLYNTITENAGGVSLKHSSNSISPNFVHSLDAAALVLTINKGASEGIEHFQMIHDDYGTHAADTQRLFEILREVFVELYEEHDVLMEMYKTVKEQLPKEAQGELEKPPKRGKFDIREVLASDYFFS